MNKWPEFFKVYKRLNKSDGYYHCHLVRDNEVETYNVCAKTLRTFGPVDKRTVQEMGWKSPHEFEKNRLTLYECVDLGNA